MSRPYLYRPPPLLSTSSQLIEKVTLRTRVKVLWTSAVNVRPQQLYLCYDLSIMLSLRWQSISFYLCASPSITLTKSSISMQNILINIIPNNYNLNLDLNEALSTDKRYLLSSRNTQNWLSMDLEKKIYVLPSYKLPVGIFSISLGILFKQKSKLNCFTCHNENKTITTPSLKHW